MVVHVTDEQGERLERISAAGGPSVNALAQEAIDSYLLWREEHIEAVQLGVAAANRGDLVDHESVRNRIELLLSR